MLVPSFCSSERAAERCSFFWRPSPGASRIPARRSHNQTTPRSGPSALELAL